MNDGTSQAFFIDFYILLYYWVSYIYIEEHLCSINILRYGVCRCMLLSSFCDVLGTARDSKGNLQLEK